MEKINTKEENIKLFTAIGLKANVVDSTVKSKKATKKLKEVLEFVKVTECESKYGNLYYDIATKVKSSIEKHKKLLSNMVKEDKFPNSKRLDLAIGYLKKHANEKEIKLKKLEEACGVGVVISDEAI